MFDGFGKIVQLGVERVFGFLAAQNETRDKGGDETVALGQFRQPIDDKHAGKADIA